MKQGIAVLVLVAAAFTACGSDQGSSLETSTMAPAATGAEASDESRFEREHPGSAIYGSPPLEFEADPDGDLAFTKDVVMAKEGNVTLEFTNPQPIRHNLVVEAASGGKEDTGKVANGGLEYTTVSLNNTEKFIFYCSVPGHRKAGMEGVIKVTDRSGWQS
jgi:uncharacterized cupredoxin-like copper-binding protein